MVDKATHAGPDDGREVLWTPTTASPIFSDATWYKIGHGQHAIELGEKGQGSLTKLLNEARLYKCDRGSYRPEEDGDSDDNYNACSLVEIEERALSLGKKFLKCFEEIEDFLSRVIHCTRLIREPSRSRSSDYYKHESLHLDIIRDFKSTSWMTYTDSEEGRELYKILDAFRVSRNAIKIRPRSDENQQAGKFHLKQRANVVKPGLKPLGKTIDLVDRFDEDCKNLARGIAERIHHIKQDLEKCKQADQTGGVPALAELTDPRQDNDISITLGSDKFLYSPPLRETQLSKGDVQKKSAVKPNDKPDPSAAMKAYQDLIEQWKRALRYMEPHLKSINTRARHVRDSEEAIAASMRTIQSELKAIRTERESTETFSKAVDLNMEAINAISKSVGAGGDTFKDIPRYREEYQSQG